MTQKRKKLLYQVDKGDASKERHDAEVCTGRNPLCRRPGAASAQSNIKVVSSADSQDRVGNHQDTPGAACAAAVEWENLDIDY